MIQRIDFNDYSSEPSKVLFTFWYSPEGGLTCSDAAVLRLYIAEGLVAPGAREIFPDVDPAGFFEHIEHIGSSYLRNGERTEVDTQPGQTVEEAKSL